MQTSLLESCREVHSSPDQKGTPTFHCGEREVVEGGGEERHVGRDRTRKGNLGFPSLQHTLFDIEGLFGKCKKKKKEKTLWGPLWDLSRVETWRI